MNSYEHTSRDFLPLSVIRSACAGDTDAVEQVLQHYRGYINKLCTGILYDKHGQPHVCIRNCFFIAHILLCLPVTRLFYGLIVPPVSLCSNSQNVLFFGTFRRIQEARSVLTIYYTALCSFTNRNMAFISSKIHLIIVLG